MLWWLCQTRADMHLWPVGSVTLPAGASHSDVLHDLFMRFKAWCSYRGVTCSCRRFTPAAIQRDRKNTLVFFRCKAAQSPVLIAWLAELTLECVTLLPESCKHEARIVSTCAWGLAQYFHVLKSSDRFFSEGQAADLDNAGHAFLHMYTELNRASADPTLWVHIPKMHQFQHLLLDALDDKNNPRFFHCFSDEDMVGIMIRTAKSCHANTVVTGSVDKYAIGLVTRMLDVEANRLSDDTVVCEKCEIAC
eukprot:4160600-Pyramimonas_sp.AAC.1